jgi:hypothetical protein
MKAASPGVSVFCLFAALCLTGPALASDESQKEAAARDAFERGRELVAAGNYEEACGKFEESVALFDAIGTTYNLADCEEHRGHFARAQRLFTRVAERARELGQTNREDLARKRESALDAKLSLISLEAPPDGVTLSLDGEPLSAEAAKSAIPVEPGKHRLSASAKGKKPWTKELDIPRARLLVPVHVPSLEDARAERPAARPTTRPARSAPREMPRQHSQGAPTVAWIIGSAGVAATLGGAYFGWRYLAHNADAKDVCPSGEDCDKGQIEEHARLVDDARTARNFSYLGFGLGAAALTSATVLFVSGGKNHELSAAVDARAGSVGATLRGRF